MYYLLLGAALLSCCTGESSLHGPPERVLAFAGRDVILPCSFSVAASGESLTVEWSREGPWPNVIFLYRDGFETYEEKIPAFKHRTSLITRERTNTNFSLRLSELRLSDAGKYQCMRLWSNTRDVRTVELVVGAVSEPKFSVVSAESGGVTLQCEADCWKPEPEIKFLDDQGNNVPADDPKRDRDVSGCFTVRRRVTLQDATNRVTCRVHQPEINQTRDAQIPILVGGTCSLITGTAVGGAVLVLLALSGLTALLWKRCGKSEGQKLPVSRQSSDQSTLSSASENHPFLKSVRAVNMREAADNMTEAAVNMREAADNMTEAADNMREAADQTSKLHANEETTCQLQHDLKSQLNPVVCQHDQPTIVYTPSNYSLDVPRPARPLSHHSLRARNSPSGYNPKPTASTTSNPPKSGDLPQNPVPKPELSRHLSNPAPDHPTTRRQRIHSSPDIFNFEALSRSSAKKKLRHVGRSLSESCAQPHPNKPKLQHRSSIVLSSSAMSEKRCMLLEDFTEESD